MPTIRIDEVVIGREKDFDDVAHLVNVGHLELVDERRFEAHGFHNDPVNKVYYSIAKAAGRIDANTAVIMEERSTKKGRYRADVSFYRDLKRKGL
ncbi:MAG: hypothetical protein V1645_03345 [archaeon]